MESLRIIILHTLASFALRWPRDGTALLTDRLGIHNLSKLHRWTTTATRTVNDSEISPLVILVERLIVIGRA